MVKNSYGGEKLTHAAVKLSNVALHTKQDTQKLTWWAISKFWHHVLSVINTSELQQNDKYIHKWLYFAIFIIVIHSSEINNS